jgi:hypothetical protein
MTQDDKAKERGTWLVLASQIFANFTVPLH